MFFFRVYDSYMFKQLLDGPLFFSCVFDEKRPISIKNTPRTSARSHKTNEDVFIFSHSEHVNFNDDDSTLFEPIKLCVMHLYAYTKREITKEEKNECAAASSYKQSLSC